MLSGLYCRVPRCYMAPEVCRASSVLSYDEKIDVFGFGVIAWELMHRCACCTCVHLQLASPSAVQSEYSIYAAYQSELPASAALLRLVLWRLDF